jgi:hypothetical protein
MRGALAICRSGGEAEAAGALADLAHLLGLGQPSNAVADRASALTQLVAERCYHEATVAQGAKVSRRGFCELFEDKERCFLAAQDPLARRLEEVEQEQAVSKAGEGQGAEAAIGAVVGFTEREPAVFTLLAHEARSATALLGWPRPSR